ncbi:MAG: hypothetical protein LBB08_02175 [Rickettsiales bacterium]|jgi:hypothetical protein|nr:hypothetical protein [Rickettsiales bacterium]
MLKKWLMVFFWTIWCVVFATVFFYILFDFDIWNSGAWRKISKTVIRGPAGLVFASSVIAAVPIYLAGAAHVIKNGRLPIKLPKLWKKKAPESVAVGAAVKKADIPEALPDEMKALYDRIILEQQSGRNFSYSHKSRPQEEKPEPAAPRIPDQFMPIPDSFDAEETQKAIKAPTFVEVNF